MIRLLYIDLFCGAGGTSSGVEYARVNGEKCAKVIACVNHDAHAIASHEANHPETLHFTEDIRTLDFNHLVHLRGRQYVSFLQHIDNMRMAYPDAKVVLWASLECTNFSRAKGGQPRDADSRTLAEHLFRYIEAINPDYIQIENVEEFMCWGDLDENGKPVSKHKGSSYLQWVKHVEQYGYHFDWRILNAADFGAYTSRKRFFGQFARNGLGIVFPEQTYAKNGDDGGMFKMYKPWKPVREVLDLQDEGESIFAKKKPLCEKTLERIFAGLVKFVAGGKDKYDAWILKYNSTNQSGHHNAPSIDEPCPTVAVQNRLGLVKCHFLSKQFSGDPSGKNISIEQPAGAVTTKDHHAFVTAYYGNGFNSSIDEPAPTITTSDRFGLVNPNFIVNYRFNNKGSSIEEPAPAICTVGQIGVASCKFIANEYSGGGQTSDIEKPCPAVLTTPKQKVVSVQYLMNPYSFKSDGSSIDKPCFTLIARMDKMPPYLISTEQGVGIKVFDTDSPMTCKIKEFMAAYGIVDIRMRMLNIRELKRIMGFPVDYILIGTQAEQKKFIGNAVEVNMSRVLCEALARKYVKVA